MEIITVKDLTKTFTYSVKEKGLRGSLHNLFARPTLQKTAVNGVSFSIEKGEAVGLLGPNGAGKTTTLKMLSGILYPTAGTATVAGFVPWERRRDYQRRFAIVMGQKTQLWPNLPALDTFELNRRIYDLDPREYQRTLDELTDLLGVGSLLQVQVRRCCTAPSCFTWTSPPSGWTSCPSAASGTFCATTTGRPGPPSC